MTITNPFDESIDTTHPPVVIGYDEDSITAAGKELVRVSLILSRPLTELEARMFKAERGSYVQGEERITANVEIGRFEVAIERVEVALFHAHRAAEDKIRSDVQTVKFAKELFKQHRFNGAG